MNNPDVALPFDTLRCANRFKAINMPDKQAEAIADELSAMININIVTKQDITLIRSDIALVRNDILWFKIIGSLLCGLIVIGFTLLSILITFHK